MGNNIFLLSFLFFVIFSLFASKFNFSKAEQMVPALFVLGDSLVDVGNNNYLPISIVKANFPHNGVDFPTKKPTGRFCNGKNGADFLAEKVGLPTSPPYLSPKTKWNAPSFLTGVSFASGGGRIFNGSDQVLGQSIHLSKQVDYYASVYEELVQQLGSFGAKNHLSKSIFVVVIGGNDLLDYSRSNDLKKKNTPQQYVDLMVIKLKEQLKRLYDKGARKFLVTGIPSIGCIPAQRINNPTKECNEKLNTWAVKYNEGLKSMLQELKSKLVGMSYSYASIYGFVHDIIENPTASGFTEVKAACCGLGDLNAKVPCLPISTYCSNRRDHIWWDLFHPTEATARMFVDIIFNDSQYTYPMNLQQLIAV